MKYCLTLPDETRPMMSMEWFGKDHVTMVKGLDDKPVSFESIDDAVSFASKSNNPMEVREYFGPSVYVYEMSFYGDYKVGKNVLKRV